MQIEREHPVPPNSEFQPDSNLTSVELLDVLKQRALDDSQLIEHYERIFGCLEGYKEARQIHVWFLESPVVRYHIGEEKFGKTSGEAEEKRNEAHDELITAIGNYAVRAKQLGHNTSWWDGPNGLSHYKQGERFNVRQKIDNWAQDIWLAQQEAETLLQKQEQEKKRESRSDRPRRRPTGRRRPAQPSAA